MRTVHTGLYVMMGVCGSGKSLLGATFARAVAIESVEGEGRPPRGNVKRMAAGMPLTDDDRHGWLISLAARLREAKRAGMGLVVACSALKRSYRDLLRSVGDVDVRFVYLAGSRALLAERLAKRREHFMPPSLLDSQLSILEVPSPDERAWVCDIREAPDAIVADLVTRLAPPSPPPPTSA